jgi:hypothetical protein
MKLEKVKKVQGNVIGYDYYKVEKEGYKVKISNMEYIELQVLEGNTEKVKDIDFNSSNSTVGQFYIPKKSSHIIKAEKKLYSKIKKSVKKPNQINKLINKIQLHCSTITKIQDILRSSYDDSVIQLQIDLSDTIQDKDKLVKKLSKLLHGKQVKKQYVNISGLQYNTIPRCEKRYHEDFIRKEKSNPFYPFNEVMNIELKKDILKRELGIIL